MVREEVPMARAADPAAAANFPWSAAIADDAQVALGAMVADLTLDLQAFEKTDKRGMPTGQHGHEREAVGAADLKTLDVVLEKWDPKSGMPPGRDGDEREAVVDAADPKGDLMFCEHDKPRKAMGVNAVDDGKEAEGDEREAVVTADDPKGDLTFGEHDKPRKAMGVNAVKNGKGPEGDANPSADVPAPYSKEAFKVEKEAENEGPEPGANPSAGVTITDLKDSSKVEPSANRFSGVTVSELKGGLTFEAFLKDKFDKEPEAGANLSAKVTATEEAFKVEEPEKCGAIYKPTNKNGDYSSYNRREPKAGTSPFAKVEEKDKTCGEGLVIKAKNKEGPEPSSTSSFAGITIPDLKGGLTFEAFLKDGKFYKEPEDRANLSAKVMATDQESFKIQKANRCGERLVVKACEEGLELKAGVLASSSTSTNSDLSNAAARVSAAVDSFRVKVVRNEKPSTVQTSLSDMHKLISEINLSQERADAAHALDPHSDLTQEQNAALALELFKVDSIFSPPFSTRILELPPPPGPMRRSSRHDYAARKKGVEAVVWCGIFTVPSSSVTGVPEIDQRNDVIANMYSCISQLLRLDHDRYVLDFLVGVMNPEVKEQVKEIISQIRTGCRKLRQEVVSLGGRPLNEPMDYWCTMYYNSNLLR